MSNDDEKKTFKIPGGELTVDADGDVRARNAAGTFSIDGETGKMTASLNQIRSVGIANIVDVISHDIKTDATATSHHLRFRWGGSFRLTYRPDGTVLECRIENLKTNISKDGDMTLMSPDESPGQTSG